MRETALPERAMILSICLSPCIDVNMEVDSLSVGKSNKILNKRIYYTGKAINAARGLKRLGAEVQDRKSVV